MCTAGLVQELLQDLAPLQWPANVKQMQANWIGKTEGAQVDFRVTLAEDASAGQVRLIGAPVLHGAAAYRAGAPRQGYSF